ncbi:MAG: Gfo/Idh/MocA family oxidoreductase [bacterium]
MDKLGICVVGAGGMIGGRRVNNYQDNPRAEVVAICDVPRENAEKIAKDAGISNVYDNWKEMLGNPDIDAVNVSTPNLFHYEISKAALEAGKHVSTEYPVCQSVEEYDDLIKTAKRKQLIFHDALTVRNEPHYMAVRDNLSMIGSPVCGRMNFFGGPAKWYIDPKIRGFMFLCYHIHYVDQFMGLFGEVSWIDASQMVLKGKNVHAGTIMMGHKSGAVSYIEFGMGFSPSSAPQITIRGDQGIIRYQTEESPKKVQILTAAETKAIIVDKETMGWTGDVTRVALKAHGDNFIDEVLDGKPSLNPFEIGRRAIEISLIAEESAAEGKRLNL